MIERGCRQGDPMSPYLFLLCVEILGIMVRENERSEVLLSMMISQFADDTQMMSEGGGVHSFEQSINTVYR